MKTISITSRKSLPAAVDRSSFLQSLILVSVVAACSACSSNDYRAEATGPEGELLVVIDSVLWESPAGDSISRYVAPFVTTLPGSERAFDVVRTGLEGNEKRIRTTKNVLFVASLSDSSAEARFLKERLPPGGIDLIQRNGGLFVERPDLWSRKQMVVYLMADSREALFRTIRDQGPRIRTVFETISRQRLTREMYARGRQQNVEAELMKRHQFAVNVQHDFLVATDTTQFVWLRRVLTDTWRSLFIYYVERPPSGRFDPEWIYHTRDSLSQVYLQGTENGWVSIDRRRPLETRKILFLGRPGFETRGLWHMVSRSSNGDPVDLGMGGPFVTFTFRDETSNRIYMIDGMVFAPGFDKRAFLQQMEVMAYTFRSQSEDAADD